jgi:hypothetical protein
VTIFAGHHYTGKTPIGFHSDGGQICEEKLETINLGFRAEILERLQLTAGINDIFNKAPEQGHYHMDQPS